LKSSRSRVRLLGDPIDPVAPPHRSVKPGENEAGERNHVADRKAPWNSKPSFRDATEPAQIDGASHNQEERGHLICEIPEQQDKDNRN